MNDTAGKVDRFIALIENRALVRECIRRSMQSALSLPVVTYSTVSKLERQPDNGSPDLVMLFLTDASIEACARALNDLSELFPSIPIIVLASENDVDLARTAMGHGAKGYFPCTTDFESVVEAVRFVLGRCPNVGEGDRAVAGQVTSL
jgi:DNA-binding NarL/FixJ family response regulator